MDAVGAIVICGFVIERSFGFASSQRALRIGDRLITFCLISLAGAFFERIF
jgi:hypothetical protein